MGTINIAELISGIIVIGGFVATWIGIYWSRKKDNQEKVDKAVKMAEDKGRHDQHQEQTDKEIGAIWSELTQHGTKIQAVETITATLSQKMDSIIDSLKEIKASLIILQAK